MLGLESLLLHEKVNIAGMSEIWWNGEKSVIYIYLRYKLYRKEPIEVVWYVQEGTAILKWRKNAGRQPQRKVSYLRYSYIYCVNAILDQRNNGYGSLRKSQHAFDKRKPCLTKLLDFFGYINKHVDGSDLVDIICLDFQRSFDVVAVG